MLLDGSDRASFNLQMMLHWDVNNGIARRNWARNPHATYAIKRAMEIEPNLKVTIPHLVDDEWLDAMF
jgi:urocanate hydratase